MQRRKGEVALPDGHHHVGAGVYKRVVEVVARLQTLLAFGVGGDEAQTEMVVAGRALGDLVDGIRMHCGGSQVN